MAEGNWCDYQRHPEGCCGWQAQLDAVTRDTALVTITAGGNDVGFAPRLTLASLPWPLPVLPAVRAHIAELGNPSTTDERFKRLGQNLAAIGRELHHRAPTCRVILIDYLTLLPPDGDDPGHPPDRDHGVRPEGRRPPRGHDRGSRQRPRLRLRGGLSRLRESPCVVGGSVDPAVPPVPARRCSVPSEHVRDGRGRRAHPNQAQRGPGGPGEP